MKGLSNVLRGIRLYYRLKQYVLAEKLSISRSYLSQIESGQRSVSLVLLSKYAEVFDMSISIFFVIAECTSNTPRYKLRQMPWRCDIFKIINWINNGEQ